MRRGGLAAFGLKVGMGSLLLGSLAILFFFPPEQGSFYPHCQFHALTGLACPGCGSLRAAHQLLHGHLLAALHLNALAVLSLPGMAWAGVRFVFQSGTWGSPGWDFLIRRPICGWLILGCLLGFGILRNLPLMPFSSLAP